MRSIQTRTIVLYGLFIAVIFLLGLTPLGYINLPIAAITTVHIPVIVGGYVLGKKGGAVLGFFFGLTSLMRCFTTPDATAAVILGIGTGFGARITCFLFWRSYFFHVYSPDCFPPRCMSL